MIKFNKNYNQNSRADMAKVNVKTEKWLIGEPDVVVLDSGAVAFVLWKVETTALVIDETISDVVVGEEDCECSGELDVVE